MPTKTFCTSRRRRHTEAKASYSVTLTPHSKCIINHSYSVTLTPHSKCIINQYFYDYYCINSQVLPIATYPPNYTHNHIYIIMLYPNEDNDDHA